MTVTVTVIRESDLRAVEMDPDPWDQRTPPEGRELGAEERIALARRLLEPLRLEAHGRCDWRVVTLINNVRRELDELEAERARRDAGTGAESDAGG